MAASVTSADSRTPVPPRGYARGPHGLVHYHDSGGRVRPGSTCLPLVLLPQSPMSARQFDAALGPLTTHRIRSIAIDTPGFGYSDPAPFVPRIEDWAGSIVAVLDHLGITRADLLGHHTGALLATEVALQAPARVRRLVLNGPFPASGSERRQYLAAMEAARGESAPAIDGMHFVRSFALRIAMHGPGPADPELITRYVVQKYQGLAPHWHGHNAAFHYDHAAAMARLTHRTLILTNTGDDIHEFAKRAAALRPDFEYQEMQGGTHDIVDQRPDEWAAIVAAFLEEGTADSRP